MKSRRIQSLLAVPLALAVAALACGSPGTPEPAPTAAVKPTVTPAAAAPAPTAVPESGAINSFRDVQEATIQIVAQGTFVDPEFGVQANAAGAGSGFLIDSSGLAVTNNHVVTGAARLKAYLNGQEYGARILGVSECADLAVVQLDGDNFPYLEFYADDVEVGLEVYAAGFPLGDPEFTLTKGIVSKARADGETGWASVESVIEHDATINPGNSGGPLVDARGRVVGINYAGNSGTNQYFAIKAQDADRVIQRLADGDDVDSLGINGQAVRNDDGSLSGIWVSSVKSGSPAERAGVVGGDIVTTMEGLNLGVDGTMTEYCDIIRSHEADDVLSIEVLRFASQEYLAGQLNGRELAVTFNFGDQISGEVQNNSGASGAGYSGYVTVQDDTGAIQVDIPQEWAQVDGSNWIIDGDVFGARISAAGNLEAFNDTYSEPGIFFAVSDEIARLGGYIQLLDLYRDTFSTDCTFSSREDYSDSAFEGKYDIFEDCNGEGDVLIVLSARPIQNQTDYLLLVLVNIMTDADVDAFEHILQTFDVVGALP